MGFYVTTKLTNFILSLTIIIIDDNYHFTNYLLLEINYKTKKMKQIYLTIFSVMMTVLSYSQNSFWSPTTYRGAFPITDNTPQTDWTHGWCNWDPQNTQYPTTQMVINTDVTTDATWSGVIKLQNKVYVRNGATLTILPGTIIRGDYNSQGTLIVTRGSRIIADGNVNQPIVFTSNNPVGSRNEGDWGGLVILGNAINNQPGGVVNIEGLPPSTNTQHGGVNDNDNSGVLRYVRIEFAGIPLEPNKEINGLTFGSVGSLTTVDYVQVSFCGDDSFEWFGGTVNCKHLISYSTIDDDFDTDFGYRGKVQFGLAIRNENLSDAAGDSNCFESDNDAQGSASQPLTSPIFSNFTIIGAKGDGTVTLPVGEKFEKAFRLRRNTATSVFNSIATGWEKGLSLEGAAVESNISSGVMNFNSNILSNFNNGTVCYTTTPNFLSSYFSLNLNDSTLTNQDINWVNPFVQVGSTPDYRLNGFSFAAIGSNFPVNIFGNIASVDELDNEYTIYPNPATNRITVNEKTFIEVIDQNGKLLVSSFDNQVELINLPNGVYFVRLNNSKVEKLIIRK